MAKTGKQKMYGGGIGGAVAFIIVYLADMYGMNLGPIGDPIAALLTFAIGGGAGAYFAPKNTETGA